MERIKIQNLSKTFKIRSEHKNTLKSIVTSRFNQGKTLEFKALDDINISIKSGESVGILGRNGSGKSTLLKLMAGLYSPDKGSSIQVNGSLIPFIQLGVGFNQDLSARENVYLNGLIVGMLKEEIEAYYDEIVDFAELHQFMEMQIKNFSTGMKVRLAFSIAMKAAADIYLLDEVLAVGDAEFKQKCLEVFKELRREGKTLVFVSHSESMLTRFCEQGVVLDHGRVIFNGSIKEATQSYSNLSKDVKTLST